MILFFFGPQTWSDLSQTVTTKSVTSTFSLDVSVKRKLESLFFILWRVWSVRWKKETSLFLLLLLFIKGRKRTWWNFHLLNSAVLYPEVQTENLVTHVTICYTFSKYLTPKYPPKALNAQMQTPPDTFYCPGPTKGRDWWFLFEPVLLYKCLPLLRRSLVVFIRAFYTRVNWFLITFAFCSGFT